MVLSRAFAAIVVVFSLRFSMAIYGVGVSETYLVLMIISALLALMIFRETLPEDEPWERGFWTISLPTLSRWLLLFSILLVLGYATKTSSIFSRKTLFTWLIVTPTFLIPMQFAIENAISRIMQATGRSRRVVIAGANKHGRSLAARLKSSSRLGMNLEGLFDDRNSDRLGTDLPATLLGTLSELPQYVQKHNIDVIYVTLPIRNIQRVTDLIDALHDTTASIYYVPDIFVFDLMQCRTGNVSGMPVIALYETPFNGIQGAVKKLSDYVIASTTLLLTSPLLITIAAVIKLTTPGSVFFRQRRYGADGSEIVVYKFRCMTDPDDRTSGDSQNDNSPRVTRIGKFLRKYSLEELPLFFNVLQGNLSVVGPRPKSVAQVEREDGMERSYFARHRVNPGIIGLAEVEYGEWSESMDEEGDTIRDYDMEYVRNWSLSLDLRIIAKSLTRRFSSHAAY
jgi:putative colanic acid biosynthesis UDP-glucose lipid carrier transferase